MTAYAEGSIEDEAQKMFARAVQTICDSYGIDEGELQRRLECFWKVEDWPADERDALLAALLRERGYKKRWAAWHRDDADARIRKSEEAARHIADQWNGPYGKDEKTEVVPIYVPVQEGEQDE